MDVRALADEDLMPLLQQGDEAAFEIVYERHSRPAFSLAYRMVGTLFRTRGGRVTVHLPHALGSHDRVLVTLEPAGGSDAPTTKPLAQAQVT